MDSSDRPESTLPAVPLRFTTTQPSLLQAAPPTAAGAIEPSRPVNLLRAAFRSVRRHWWQIPMLWALISGGLCYLIMTRINPVYESVSLLKVEPSSRGLFDAGAHASESFAPFLETQVQLVLSPNVLSATLANPKVAAQPTLRGAGDAESVLRAVLAVGVVQNSYLLRVSMKSTSSAECAVIVNAVVDVYLSAAAEWADGMTRAQIKSLESYQRELKAQADEKKEAWLALASKGNVDLQFGSGSTAEAGGTSLPMATRSRVTADEYKRVRDELFKVNMEMTQAKALLEMREQEYARSASRFPVASAAPNPDRALRNDPEVLALSQHLDKAKSRYERTSRLDRTKRDPATIGAARELAAVQQQYNQLVEEKRAELPTQVLEDAGAPPLLREARDKAQTLTAARASYEKMLSQIEVTNRQEGSDAVKSALVREALASINQMEQAVVKRLEQLRFESKGEARISRVSEARATSTPTADNRRKFLTMTPPAVLLLVLALFVTLEVKTGRVSDLEDYARIIPAEVFALPPLPGPRLEPGQRGARAREGQLQEFVQSLDHLRAALCETPAPVGGGRCLIVTSANAAEGKTTLSAQLAACCAKAGISTLLIDADLRRATLSRMLNEEKSPGISDVLQGEIAAENAPVSIGDAGFHLLPAGSSGRDPACLFKGDRVGQVLARYRQLFDLILIDTPPILPVPDALTLGRWADGAILVARFDVSRLALVDRARRRLNSAGVTLLKTVVNGVKTSRFYDGYGSCYGYSGYSAYAAHESRTIHPPEPTSTTV